MPFKKEDSLSALFSLVVLSQMCKRSILRLNLTSILCSELHGQVDFKLVREKSVEGFWSYLLFRKKKKTVLIIIPYLKRF